jgi:hypothetical protein
MVIWNQPEEGVAQIAADGDIRLQVTENVLDGVRSAHVGENSAGKPTTTNQSTRIQTRDLTSNRGDFLSHSRYTPQILSERNFHCTLRLTYSHPIGEKMFVAS